MTAGAGFFKIIIIAKYVVGLLHPDAPGTDKKIAAGHIVIAISERQHPVLIIGECVITQDILAAFDRNHLAVTESGVVEIAILDEGP